MPRARRSWIYPYPRLPDDLVLRVRDISLDGRAPAVDPIVHEFRTADLSRVEPADWAALGITVEVEIPVDQFEKLTDPVVCVVGNCSRTNVRVSGVLHPSDTGRWAGTLSLHRAYLAGAIDLRASVGARINGDARLVGESVPWSLHVDEPAIPVIEGTLPVRWEDFENTDTVPDPYKKEPFFADLTAATPVVYLNSGYEGLPDLLSDDDHRPVGELALREAEFRRIGTSVWLGMFNISAAAVERGDDDTEPDWPAADWQRQVLETVLPTMYGTNPIEALGKLTEGMDGEGMADIQTRAAAAVAAVVDRQRALKKRIAQLARSNGAAT